MRRGPPTGILLGVANAFVISLAMAVASHEIGVGVFVFVFSVFPAVFAGMILGAFADAFAAHHRALRLSVLGAPAIGVLIVLAKTFGLLRVVPLAAIPTLVAVILLERATRRAPMPPPLPPAVVRSSSDARTPPSV